ncbi:MAG: cupin domain-containing protein [Gemmatimonadaceae bacterium]|nr:cupin domain-containing protein [Gemmatimonadaceae bacterium]
MHTHADTTVFHICSRAALAEARARGVYRAGSLLGEGFIHLSRAHQVPGTARAFFAGVPDLVLLVIDPTLLTSPLVYEPPAPPPGATETDDRAAELFPHCYGPLDLDAIIDVVDLATFDGTPVHADTAALLRHYRFDRLPLEGTLYRSTWRSTVENDAGEPAGTAMIGLYADSPRSVSCFHRLAHAEVWHVHAGDPFTLHLLHEDGRTETVLMGTDPTAGQQVQHVIPAGSWQAGCLVPGGRHALFGCTMAPGFTGTCFEAAVPAELAARYPGAADVIARLSVTGGATRMPAGFAT